MRLVRQRSPPLLTPNRAAFAKRRIGTSADERLHSRGGQHAADFPNPFIVDEPISQDAN